MHKERYSLGRTVDQDGNVRDSLVQRRRDQQAAQQCFRKLRKGWLDVPRVILTDPWQRYGAAPRERLPGGGPRHHRSVNNHAAYSHQPPRQRERRMQRFTSPGHAHRFLAAYGPLSSHCRPRRHRYPTTDDRQDMRQRCQMWGEIPGIARPA